VPESGDWYQNIKTKELARLRVAPVETYGRALAADLWLPPGGAVAAEHVHDHLDERFTVLAGELTVSLAGKVSTAGPGAVIDAFAGEAHEWHNAGDEVAHVLIEVRATAGSGPMAVRFVEMIEAGFGLANTGRTNDKGLPTPLWLAALAEEYRDVMRFTKPPEFVQRALFGPLAALARRTGRDPAAAWLHGPGCPAQLPMSTASLPRQSTLAGDDVAHLRDRVKRAS
jgi:quercetin dioxygenase-like cupin family protein